jgi:hypothetical protein
LTAIAVRAMSSFVIETFGKFSPFSPKILFS